MIVYCLVGFVGIWTLAGVAKIWWEERNAKKNKIEWVNHVRSIGEER